MLGTLDAVSVSGYWADCALWRILRRPVGRWGRPALSLCGVLMSLHDDLCTP